MDSAGLPVIFHDAFNTSSPSSFRPHVFTFNCCMSSTFISSVSLDLIRVSLRFPCSRLVVQIVLLTPDHLSNIDVKACSPFRELL